MTVKEMVFPNKKAERSVFLKICEGGKADAPSGDNRRAVEKAISVYGGMLSAWLTRKIGSRETAEDISQQVYEKALHYAGGTIVENPKALLFKIAANLTANEFRRRAQESAHFVQIEDVEVLDGSTETTNAQFSPEQQADDRQKLDRVKGILKDLPERQRKAFLWNRFEGKTYSEIALLLNVSVSTVEKDFMKALLKLREI